MLTNYIHICIRTSLTSVAWILTHHLTVAVTPLILAFVTSEHVFVPLVIKFDQVEVLDEIQIFHAFNYILTVDGLTLLGLGDVAALACYESDKFTDALLNALTSFFWDFCIRWQRIFHYSIYIGYWQEAFLVGQRIDMVLASCHCRCFIISSRVTDGDSCTVLRNCLRLELFYH